MSEISAQLADMNTLNDTRAEEMKRALIEDVKLKDTQLLQLVFNIYWGIDWLFLEGEFGGCDACVE